MSLAHQAIKAATAVRLDAGLVIVRKLLSENTAGLTTQELYRLVLKEKAPSSYRAPEPIPRYVPPGDKPTPPEPPHPQHPIHSMSFLKEHVLPVLEQKGEFRKSRITRTIEQRQAVQSTSGKNKRKDASVSSASSSTAANTVEAWVWRPFAGPSRTPDKALQWPKRRPFGEEVGVGADWSHLNKRRRSARERKVAATVQAMKEHDVRESQRADRAMLQPAA